MRASSWALPLLVLAATGCERLPEDPVFIYGQVRHGDGSPAGRTPLRVERALDERNPFSDDPSDWETRTWRYAPYSEGTTEAAGSFTLEALAGDLTAERYYEDGFYAFLQHRFRLYPPLGEDGNGVFADFFFQDDVELPPMQHWATDFTVSDGPEGPTLSFTPVPPPLEVPPSATLPRGHDGERETDPIPPSPPEPVVQLHGGDGLVWQQVRAASPWVPTPYMLEDFSGVEGQVRAASLGRFTFEPLGAQYSDLSFRMEWRGPRVALPAGGLRPVSRGTPCSPAPVDGPCPYTDGKLAAVDTHPGSTQPGPNNPQGFGVEAMTFSLDAPTRIRRVVVRGLETTLNYDKRMQVVLEGSADGGTWSPLGSHLFVNYEESTQQMLTYQGSLADSETDSPFDGPLALFPPHVFLDAPLVGETPVRYVRLRVTSEDGGLRGRLVKLAEVSLFE